MSDLGKVVQKLTETNLRLETLEKQNIESGTAASIIAQSLPEVLNDRSIATNRESFDKKEGITGTDDDVRDNTKKLGKKIDKLNMNPKKDDDPNFIGPPLAPSKTGSDEEEDSDRQKALKKVFNPLTKSFNAVSKSITGFIGGMAKTVTGGAELFLKGIVTATALGLLIKFLKSDYFKEFLSEENLKKLADFFKNIGAYMDDLFDYLADTTNPSSIAFAIAAGAGIFLAGGLISKIIGGVVGTFKFLRTLGTLFGIGGALSATATAAGTTSVATTAATAAGGIGLLGTAAVVAGVALLAKMSYEGIAAAQKSYMEGNTFGRVVADGLGAFLTLGMFPDLAKAIADFLSPTDDQKINKKTSEIDRLRKQIKRIEDTDTKTQNEKQIEFDKVVLKESKKLLAKKLAELKIVEAEAPTNAQDKKNRKNQLLSEKEFAQKKKDYIKDERARLKVLAADRNLKFKNISKMDAEDKRIELIARNKTMAIRLLGNQFEEKFGDQNPRLVAKLAKKEASNLKEIKAVDRASQAFAIIGAGNPELESRITGLKGVARDNDERMNMATTIINNQTDNSITENKNSGAKPVFPFLNPKYIDSF